MYRNTYAQIDLRAIEENVKKIINKYNNYKYYFGVVKADAYGHTDLKVVKRVISGGCNYLAVSSLEEAIKIRRNFPDIPILCLEPVDLKYISKCEEYNVTLTISSIKHLEKLLEKKYDNLKVHIKIDTGMNRLGIKTKEEFNKIYNLIKENNIYLEGVYSHICWANNKYYTLNQFKKFKDILSDIDYTSIPIIHLPNSETLVNYPKLDIVNGTRLGIIMYGFTDDKKLNLESTFSVISEIIEIKNIKKGEIIGYSGVYQADQDITIGIISIGYADGIIRSNTGRNVLINNREYPIVGNICMDMLMVKIDERVDLYDKVYIIKDVNHINKIAQYTKTIPYEIICLISKRVAKRYKE